MAERSDRQAKALYFAHLSYSQLEARLRGERKLVLLFPVGATEAHGPHSPLSTDVIISDGMCRRAAQHFADDAEIDVLILPSLSYVVTRYAGQFTGTIHVSEATLQAMIVDVCRSLIGQGFRHIILVNNHFEPEHVQTLHRSIDAIQAATSVLVGYLDLTRRERAARLTEEFKKSECHAGRYETSLVLADQPEWVDVERMAALPEVPISLVKVIGQGHKDFVPMGLTQAYNGDPASATAEEGEESFAILTAMLVELIRALADGTGGRDMPGFYNRV
jgi:creatinine amidohydrolase